MSPVVEWLKSWIPGIKFWTQTAFQCIWIILLGLSGAMLFQIAVLLSKNSSLSEYHFLLVFVFSWLAVVAWHIPQGAFQARKPVSSFAVRIIMVAIPVGIGWYFVRHGVGEVFWMGIAISSFAVSYNIRHMKTLAK